MKLEIDLRTDRVDEDAYLRNFVVTTVRFATHYYASEVRRITVQIDDAGDAALRCVLKAETDAGIARSSAIADDVCEAVQEAANLVEVELFQALSGASAAAA